MKLLCIHESFPVKENVLPSKIFFFFFFYWRQGFSWRQDDLRLSPATSAVFGCFLFFPRIVLFPLSLCFNDTVRLWSSHSGSIYKNRELQWHWLTVSEENWHKTPKPALWGADIYAGEPQRLLGRAPTSSEQHCRGDRDSGSTVFARRSNQRPAADSWQQRFRWMSRPLCWTHTLHSGTFLSVNTAWVNDLFRQWVLTALTVWG